MSQWWKVWDCDVHRSCSSVQHALIAIGIMVAAAGAVHVLWAPVWTIYAFAVLVSAGFGLREEMQLSGFMGWRHRTNRGKWDSIRDFVYPTVATFVTAGLYHGVMR